MREFWYLNEKIRDAEFEQSPFPHLFIQDWLSPEHFEAVTTAPQIKTRVFANHRDMISSLIRYGYEVVQFPGCTKSVDSYLSQDFEAEAKGLTAARGMAFRLKTSAPLSEVHESASVLFRLLAFLNSDSYHKTVRSKLGLTEPTRVFSAAQKYATGYEISPHPDVRRKAATYLANINTTPEAERAQVHTHLLRFKPEHRAQYDKWEAGTAEREWVPWTWCEVVKTARQNNSLLMFACDSRSLHAVKLNYDHLPWQRTQLYGNLYFEPRKL